ncbi:MAG: 1-deoxy-D-xylulose-5-phosphate reductoisomerase, partial [Acidobacteriota bacterium]
MARVTRRAISILGSTGSVGVQALDLIERFPDRFEVVALAAGRNAALLARQVGKHRPRLAAIGAAEGAGALQEAARLVRCEVVTGQEGLLAVASFPAADIVVAAVVGAAGLPATYHALRAGKRVALANKESLVMAGPLLQQT